MEEHKGKWCIFIFFLMQVASTLHQQVKRKWFNRPLLLSFWHPKAWCKLDASWCTNAPLFALSWCTLNLDIIGFWSLLHQQKVCEKVPFSVRPFILIRVILKKAYPCLWKFFEEICLKPSLHFWIEQVDYCRSLAWIFGFRRRIFDKALPTLLVWIGELLSKPYATF